MAERRAGCISPTTEIHSEVVSRLTRAMYDVRDSFCRLLKFLITPGMLCAARGMQATGDAHGSEEIIPAA
jgi:hypothetical protein